MAPRRPARCRPARPQGLSPGTVGRLLPVSGIAHGGGVLVRRPNITLGYLLASEPGKFVPPRAELGAGWHDTGDIVSLDERAFIAIQGRAKRFAKVGGEMVSLAAAEEPAASV